MPSPFPGMDPYLESPDWFPCLHDCLIIGILGALQQRLPESYYAQSTQRIYLEDSERYVEQFIEVRRRTGSEVQVVRSIEMLSLSNQTIGSVGREKYITKQQEILNSRVHLVEIDLLRGGERATALPKIKAHAQVGPFAYHGCVHRFNHANAFLVYPIQLEQRLPTIAIPLSPGDPDVALPLQSIFDQAYEIGPYRKGVDYNRDAIVPPLTPAQADWARARLTPSA